MRNDSLRKWKLCGRTECCGFRMTYAQPSIIGFGGYMPKDVQDVQKIMACGKWNLESIITHEFPLEDLGEAIHMAGDVNHAGNVVIKM